MREREALVCNLAANLVPMMVGECIKDGMVEKVFEGLDVGFVRVGGLFGGTRHPCTRARDDLRSAGAIEIVLTLQIRHRQF